MHYYSFHINDYRAATAHLSNEEDLAYRRLIDMYYDTENKIPLDTHWVSRRIRVGIKVVEAVLIDMFIRTEDGWMLPRCQEEIEHYHQNAQKNRENGRRGGRPKKTQSVPSGIPVATQLKPDEKATINHEIRTINKELKDKDIGADAPIALVKKAKHEKFRPSKWLTDRGVPVDIAEDWLKVRVAKKLVHTERAFESVAKEAEQANMSLTDALEYCVKKSWGGFEAKWIENDRNRSGDGNGQQRMTAHQASVRAAGIAIFGNLEGSHAKQQSEIIDITPRSQATGLLDSEDL